MRRSTLIAVLCTAILAACATKTLVPPETGMVKAIQEYETGIFTNNLNMLIAAVCPQDIDSTRAKFSDLKLPVTANGAYDISGIVFDTIQSNGNLAVLDIVSGKGKINIASGVLKGPIDMAPISNRFILKKEDGAWKVCFGAVNEVKITPTQSNGNGLASLVALGRLVVFAGSGVVCILLGFKYLRAGNARTDTADDLEDDGIVTQAEILGRSAKNAITYRYSTPDGKTHEMETRITTKDYNALKVGDSIEVRYLPENPSVHLIERGATEAITTKGIIASGYLFIATGLLIIVTLVFLVVWSLN